MQQVRVLKHTGPPNPEIVSLCFDSRKAGHSCAFFALRGTRTDGHEYIGQAIESGAAAVICERIPDAIPPEVSCIRVENSVRALGLAASSFYGHPSRKIRLVGVTGTNGKTTVATLLQRLFSEAGRASGLISTVKYLAGDKEISPTHTTPDALQINGLLAEMVQAGCENCFMEVSSHAIDQGRIGGLQFAGGIFTNITHEHLDYHGSFRDYIQAKKAFFDALPEGAFALVNRDDKNALLMVQNTRADRHTYGLKGPADYKGRILEYHLDGMQMQIGEKEVWTRLAGEFNASNLLAVYGTALLCGLERETVLTLLSRQVPVPGRFEILHSSGGITAIVDYAHTPDALENVLESISRAGNARIITVVGAGGNRDAGKRPLMGKVAADRSQKLILTSDNPRNEKPEDIISQMMKGIPADRQKEVLRIPDRREAIKTAVILASGGDIILVAGKGHENYQEILGVRQPFNDLEVLRELLNSKS